MVYVGSLYYYIICSYYACTSSSQLDARSAEAWLGRYGMMIISYIDILTRLVIRRDGITICYVYSVLDSGHEYV